MAASQTLVNECIQTPAAAEAAVGEFKHVLLYISVILALIATQTPLNEAAKSLVGWNRILGHLFCIFNSSN